MFTTCVDCFEYVELGRNFGNDFGKCLLRLDVAKLRMLQWGESIGLSPQQHTTNLQLSGQEAQVAEDLLGQIQDSFSRAKDLSNGYRIRKEGARQTSDGTLAVFNPTIELDPVKSQVHFTTKELAKRRQATTSLTHKTKWALYEKRRFTSLIGEVDGFVNDLIDLVPASKSRQEAICKADMREFGNEQSLKVLNEVAAEDDVMLKEAIAHQMKSVCHTYSHFEAEGNAKYHLGDKNHGTEGRSSNASHFVLRGDSDGQIGNVNYAT